MNTDDKQETLAGSPGGSKLEGQLRRLLVKMDLELPITHAQGSWLEVVWSTFNPKVRDEGATIFVYNGEYCRVLNWDGIEFVLNCPLKALPEEAEEMDCELLEAVIIDNPVSADPGFEDYSSFFGAKVAQLMPGKYLGVGIEGGMTSSAVELWVEKKPGGEWTIYSTSTEDASDEELYESLQTREKWIDSWCQATTGGPEAIAEFLESVDDLEFDKEALSDPEIKELLEALQL